MHFPSAFHFFIYIRVVRYTSYIIIGRAGVSPPSRTCSSIIFLYIYLFGRAGASPPSRTAAIIFPYIYLFIYIGVVRRALNLLRASFSPIFQYFSAVNVTRVSFSQIFQYFLTCMPCAIYTCHGFLVRVLNKEQARLSRRRLVDRERARARRGSETATQREVRLARHRIADRSRHVSESQSTEEREARLHQLRVTQQQRIATESTEERGPSSAGAGHSATEDCY